MTFVIISDNQDETCLIITINDTSTCDLTLIINISDTTKNHPNHLDSDNQNDAQWNQKSVVMTFIFTGVRLLE